MDLKDRKTGGLSTILIVFLIGYVASDADFGYDSGEQMGPEHWAEHYQACAGKYQSPIDIDEMWVKRTSLPPLEFEGFYDLPMQTKITNNGHTVLLELNQTQEVVVKGGPLNGSYTFAQLHFHWGQNDSVGSEDKINSHSYSMELHMVFYKTEYESVKHAMDYRDGLLVLAIFYEAGDLDNDVYAEITDSLPKIETPNTSYNLRKGFTLRNFLPHNVQRYFTYYGSLTTPPCLEIVTWIDFKHPTRLSHRQLSAFRKIRTKGGLLTHNYRPLQPLSDRVVYYNAEDYIPKSGTLRTAASLLLMSTATITAFVML
ncbi:carbonic anhydrase 2-like [Lycorma delicatula]|uniref:carbonic anhydrase 2-like n=1 Tax=Lycorma delicatula TaxID=130591 RepID=UPI003F51A00C